MGPAMSKAFTQGDQRRVSAAFEEVLPDGFDAEVAMSKDRKHLRAVVMDADEPGVYIASAQFDHNEKALKGSNAPPRQPPDAEVMRIAAEFCQIIASYPAAKAHQAAEQLFKADFAERKQAAREQEAEAAQLETLRLAEEAEQRSRDKTDAAVTA